jgi:hypothetical protein
VHSLEEEVHMAIVKLREQKNRSAIVKLRGGMAKGIFIPDVVPALAGPQRIEEFRRVSQAASAYLSGSALIDAEIGARIEAMGFAKNEKRAEGDDQFWQEE